MTDALVSKAYPEAKEAPMDPEAVLELMSSAAQRYETVRASLRYRGDGPTIKALRERFSRSEAYRRTFGLPVAHPNAPGDPEPDGPFEWRCRVWLIDNDRWRVELALPDGGVDMAASTGRMRSADAPEGPAGTSELWERRICGDPPSEAPKWLPQPTDTFWTMYPFDPSGVCSLYRELGWLELVAEGPVRWAGREAFRLRGVPVEEWEYPPNRCGGGRMSTRRSWTQSGASCCAWRRGWVARTSTPWRWKRSTSTNDSLKRCSIRADLWLGGRGSFFNKLAR